MTEPGGVLPFPVAASFLQRRKKENKKELEEEGSKRKEGTGRYISKSLLTG